MKHKARQITARYASELTVFIALALLCVILSVMSPYFFQVGNILNIGLYSSIMGISATAMTMCVIANGIDLSVGSTMALSGMFVADMATKTSNPVLIVGVGLLIGLACGTLNGIIITRGKISSFITTISTQLIFRGFAYIYSNGGSIICNTPFLNWLGRGYIIGIPVPLMLMLICFLVFGFVLSKTEFGRNVYAVGGNAAASYLAGLNVNRTQLIANMLSGLMGGMAGLVITAQSGAGLPQAADGLQMDIIAAVILGGSSLNGGKGNVIGTLLGILLLSTLSNGMSLLNIPSFWQMVAKGAVLILAVLLDVARSGGYSKKKR